MVFVVISPRYKCCVLKKSGVAADVMRTVYKEYFNTVFDYYVLRIITTLGSNLVIHRIHKLFYLELLIFYNFDND